MDNSNPNSPRGKKRTYTAERSDDGYIPAALRQVHADPSGLSALNYSNDTDRWVTQGRTASERAAAGHLPKPTKIKPDAPAPTPWWMFWR